MKKSVPAAFVLLASTAAFAQDTRQLDAHEHGVGQLDIAFDGDSIAMELHAPGADIVGFEFVAKSSEDRAKVDDAVARLARPLVLFSLPASAGCGVVEASAALENEEEHKEEGHDHAEHKGEDHAEHKEEGHAHDDAHDHEDHADAAGHTEFHAEYILKCTDTAKATLITFAYFDTFPNALELEVQVITDRGATAFEVKRGAPTLDLRELF